MSLFIGIDLGSTTIKVIAYDLGGNAVASGTRPMRRHHPDPDHPEWTVWDSDEIWKETADACREAVSKIDDPTRIKGVATTGMGMDGLPMDERGKALYPLISWHDPRTQPQYDWWIRNITAEKTYAVGGNPVWAINSALRMKWMQENEPDVFARTYKWLLIEDYLNHCLTGRFCTDFSMASCTMLFDQRTQTWSEEMCRLSQIPISILPEAMQSGTFIGEIAAPVADRTGLPVGTPVFLGGHDHICSSLPVGAFQPGAVMNITGTWETVGFVAQEPPLDAPLGRYGITTQSHVVPKAYMVWGGSPAGEMVEWYRREIAASIIEEGKSRPLDWKDMVSRAETVVPGSGGVVFLPHLNGSSCPHVDPRSRGTFIGLNTRTTHAEIIRSIIEGLDYQMQDIVTTMETGAGKKATEIIAVGGAIRNSFWMQNKADVTGLTVHVPGVEEATVLGVAILAGIGAGLYRDAEDACSQVAKPGKTYHPDEKLTARYSKFFDVYRDLYSAVAPLHHRLLENIQK